MGFNMLLQRSRIRTASHAKLYLLARSAGTASLRSAGYAKSCKLCLSEDQKLMKINYPCGFVMADRCLRLDRAVVANAPEANYRPLNLIIRLEICFKPCGFFENKVKEVAPKYLILGLTVFLVVSWPSIWKLRA